MAKRKIDNQSYKDEKTLSAVMSLCDTVGQVAEYFGMSRDTLENWTKAQFGCTPAEYRKKCLANLSGQLKNKAIQKALSGDNQMLKFTITNLSKWTDGSEKAQEVAENEVPRIFNFNKSSRPERTLEDIEAESKVIGENDESSKG